MTTRTDPLGLMGGPIPIHIGDHVVYLNPGPLPGHGHACEMGNVPSLCFTESVGADSQSFAHSGGPTTQIFPGFINAKSSAVSYESLTLLCHEFNFMFVFYFIVIFFCLFVLFFMSTCLFMSFILFDF